MGPYFFCELRKGWRQGFIAVCVLVERDFFKLLVILFHLRKLLCLHTTFLTTRWSIHSFVYESMFGCTHILIVIFVIMYLLIIIQLKFNCFLFFLVLPVLCFFFFTWKCRKIQFSLSGIVLSTLPLHCSMMWYN